MCKICEKQSRYWFEYDGICWYCIAKEHGYEIQLRQFGDTQWIEKQEVKK